MTVAWTGTARVSCAIQLDLGGGRRPAAARIEWLHMADAYRRLAELADRNAMLDLVYGPPIRFVAQQILPRPEDKEKV